MIHDIEIAGEKFRVHSFHFAYGTAEKQGLPAEHGSSGRLHLVIKEDGNDKKSGASNFKTARSALWKRAVGAPFDKKDKITEEIKLFVRQHGGEDDSRKIEFKGWVISFSERYEHPINHGDAGDAEVTAELFVWPRDSTGYTPAVS